MAKLLFDHFVVLMLENRSFDHVFGYLGSGEGVPPGGFTNYLKPGDSGTSAFTSRQGGDYTAIGEGPSHSLKSTNMQLFGVSKPTPDQTAQTPAMNGFAASFQGSLQFDLKRKPVASEIQQVMNCFTPEQLPVLSMLAKNFVLCDRWFADVPGPTMPNRAFVHAATSQGYTYNADWKPKFDCKTIYDRIGATDGCSWRVYSHDQNDVAQLFPYVKIDETNLVPFEGHFAQDVAGDKLATYTFVCPGFQSPANSMHAPADVRPAEKLVADIYSALRSQPDVWKKTLLIVVFDEHGGYYDHVPPPTAVSPDGIAGRMDESFLVPFDFKRLGLRVPAILISPWFEPAVDSTVYSHSTIPGSVIEALALRGGFLTQRDKQAAKLTERYLVDNGKRTWRTQTPDVTVPAQPKPLDAMQRELLDGAVHMDPHPELRDSLRTRDINDPAQAKRFVRTQVAKHVEHFIASKGKPDIGSKLSADNQLPSTNISPARISELRDSAPVPRRKSKKSRAAQKRKSATHGASRKRARRSG